MSLRSANLADRVPPRLATQYQTPSSSSTPPNQSKQWKLIGLLAAFIGLGAAYYFYRRSSKGKSSPSKPSSKQSSHDSAALKDIQTKVAMIKQSIDKMTSSGEAIDIEPWRNEIEKAQAPSSNSVNLVAQHEADYRYHLVKLFATYHTLRNLMIATTFDPTNFESKKTFDEWKIEQEKDLVFALKALESINQEALSAYFTENANPSEEQVSAFSATHLLALELAQRLNDMEKLRSTYETLARGSPHGEQLADRSQDDLLALFMTSPLLGAWADFKRFGDELIRRNGAQILENFHAAALEDSIYPDYKLLLEKASLFQSKQTASQPLMWAKFDVTELILTHDRSFSPNPMINEQLQQLAAQGKEPRRVVPEPHTMPFQVTGAIARMQSPFMIELPCVGLFNDAGFTLYASAKVKGDPTTGAEGESQGGSQCEIEMSGKKSKSSQQGKEREYDGSFIVRDYALDSQGQKGPMTVEHVFDLKVTLRRDD